MNCELIRSEINTYIYSLIVHWTLLLSEVNYYVLFKYIIDN